MNQSLVCVPLLCKELRANWKLTALFAAVLTMYSVVIISMFDPALGESLTLMAQSMPELFAMFGMLHTSATMLQFLSNYLYGFLFVVFPLVLILLLVHRLLARYAERGAMAWLLATPVPRRCLVRTQACVLCLWVTVLTGYLTALCMICSDALFPGVLEKGGFLRVNAGLLGLLLFFAALCWLGACIFAGGRWALSGGGLCVAFVLVQMAGQAGDCFNWLRYLTPLTLFDAQALAAGESGALGKALVLYLLAAAGFAAAGTAFVQKELSL